MNVLVFGCGYIGLPLVSELIARGHRVTAADRWFFGRKPTNCDTYTGDIRSFDFALSIGRHFEAVIDLCGLSNDATAEIDPDLTRSINCDGAIRFAEAAKKDGVRRYLYASSASVYGHGDKRNLTETDVCYPVSLYAQCKLLVEDHLRSIAGDGFEPVIFRNATVFGYAPRMRFDLVINMMVRMAKVDQKIYVMGGGEQWRPFVHIKDLVHVFASMIEAPAELVAGETFNVGSDAMNYQIKDVARIIASRFPFAKVHDIPDNVDRRDYHLSFSKLAKLATVTPEVWLGVTNGVEEIAAELERSPELATDPTTHTLNWYQSMLEWDRRLTDLKLDGRLL